MGYDTRYEKIRFAFLKRRFYLGLFVFLPVFFSVFALAVPLIVLAKFKPVLQRHIAGSEELLAIYNSAEQWTYIFALAAFIAGIVVAYGLVRPAKKLLKEDMVDKDIEEFGSLGKEFEKIALSLKKYASLIGSVTGGIIALNRKGEITMANPHACRILGYAETDIVGRNINSLLNMAGDFEMTMSGRVVTSELNIRTNEEDRAIGYTLSPIKGKDAIGGAVLAFMDMTEIKDAYSEIQKTENLASIGALAMDVAHEVRNPLASIKGLVQLIGEDLKDDSRKRLYIDTILKEIERLNRVVDSISEKRTAFATQDNLKEMVHRIVLLCSQAVKGKDVRVTEEYDGLTEKMQAGDERLFHAIYNIVLNAYEAVEKDGEINIQTKRADNGISIEVSSDSVLGPGIMADSIFEADVTTKGKGHGAGLKITRDAIKSIGGDIRVEASEGKTRFVIRLPQA